MFWIRPDDGPVLITTLSQWRGTAENVQIEIVESTLQGLVSRAEMVDAKRSIFAGCLIEVDGQQALDVESSLEFARWLCMGRRSAMMWVPLEPSSLCLFDALPIEALCIDPLWHAFGVQRIQQDVLKWFERQTDKRIVLRIDPNVIHMEDAEWLRAEGWCLNTEVEV